MSLSDLDIESPQDDALEQQLAEMEADLQHMWGVNEDLQAELLDTQWTSAESYTKISRDLELSERVINITGLLKLPVVQCQYVVH